MAKDVIFSDSPANPSGSKAPVPETTTQKETQLSNPFSTGGGGHNFENHVQASFVVLMLSGGVAPCLHPWPIKKIKLQGRYADFNTDDFIAFVEERNGTGRAKLLAQIKHSLNITENDPTFAKVMQAAWADFKKPDLFDLKSDAIALITGPLSAHDIENARRVLEWARTSANAQEFLNKVNLGKFSSDAKREKLQAFRAQLKKANGGKEISDQDVWQFLKCFHILGYDLDIRSGVTLSLLNSHIAQFTPDNITAIWAVIAKEVETFNQNAGTITHDTLSQEIRNAFLPRLRPEIMPKEFLQPQPQAAPAASPDYFNGEHADALVIASLIGGWNDKVEADKAAIRELIEVHD
jgi:hypothetical protein